ncbi:MAG TPA: ATP-binding protein [Terriglobales bacterium]|nr:ATP-binding protein [Terriglobales bacterium]
MKRTVEKTVLTGFVIVLALLGIVGVVSQRTIHGLIDDSQWVNHTHEVLELLQHVSFQITQAEASVRGFVITANSRFESQYLLDRSGLEPLLSELKIKISDNPAEQAKLLQLEAVVGERFSILDDAIQRRKTGGLPAVLALSKSNRGLILSAQITNVIGEMRNEENRLLAERNRRERESSRRAFLVVLFAIMLAMTAVLASVFLAFRDLTRRREVDRLKSEFVSVVSHELRTPLTSIHGSLGLLSSGLLESEKGKRMLEIAVNNTDRLIRLLNDILDIEKLESGSVQMNRTVCGAGDLIRRSVEVMKPMADEHKVTIRVSEVQATIDADCDRILQCLTNLLSNAIKFSHPGGSQVSIKAAVGVDDVQFEVTDHGRGIPADKRESIFERFHQVDASDSRRKGGTGLGLAITRSIVLQHGGRIWVTSELGKGSSFFFTIPLANVRQNDSDEPKASLIGMSKGQNGNSL